MSIKVFAALHLFLFVAPSMAQTTVQAALSTALRDTPAVGVIIDVKSGRQLAAVRAGEAARPLSPPGSILKPLFLTDALEQHEILAQTTVFCRRDLHISEPGREWNLACTHPQSPSAFGAREALAYSCNRYFAELADRISPAQAARTLEHYGLVTARAPQSRQQKELLVLGLAGIAVSPAQIATAYRRLALKLDDAGASPALEAVRQGLRDSVTYGMAHNADVPGVEIAGKTGTASDGWFAGTSYLKHKEIVTVIYLPRGNGGDAARLAQHFFLAAQPPVAEQTSASSLTVELFSARTVKTLKATPWDHAQAPLVADWTPDGFRLSPGKIVRQTDLSGGYRVEAIPPDVASAAGKWTIAWRPDGLRVLLTLPSENYVIAALNGEAAADEPLASLKAMAISVRTFALVNAKRHGAEGFQFCDSTHCQALRLGKARPEIERAVRETAGETLWFGGERAHVFYSQHCGGMSESAAAVWPTERASYLPGHHSDPYCLRRSAAEWHARISLVQLNAIFHAQGWQTPFPIEAILVTRRSEAGRASLIEITGHGARAVLSGTSFHFAVDRALGWNQMRSDWYTTSVAGGALEIRGKGYGHGVGLCQAGSYEMAVEGRNEADILSFYFPGASIGITPSDHGFRTFAGVGWSLLTTGPASELLAEGNAAWSKAQSLLGRAAAFTPPVVDQLPTTELFRQTAAEPGWMLASTRGSLVLLQPSPVQQSHGSSEALLLHEFLHVLVDEQAGESAPLWLREGLVETLAEPAIQILPFKPKSGASLPLSELEEALTHPRDVDHSRQAHQLAGRMAAQLLAHYGMPAVLGFLRNGVPSEVVRSLQALETVSAAPNEDSGSLSGARR